MLNKKNIFALILCSIFAVGILNFVETVEAVKWEKYDSGTVKMENDTFNYKTYIRGSNQIQIDISYKKTLLSKTYIRKNQTGINSVTMDNKGKTIKRKFIKTKMDIKTFYTHFKKGFKLVK